MMEENNKIVVKVKYQGLKKEAESVSQPKMVNEWHILRILAAIALLIGFIVLAIYFFNGQSTEPVDYSLSESELKSPENPARTQKNKIVAPVTKSTELSVKREPAAVIVDPPQTIKKEKVEEESIGKEVIAKPVMDSNILINPKIVRTLLTTDLKDKEPVDNISSILSVNKDRAAKVYYFTEIIDMKGQVLYHRWIRNGQLIFKRKINILGNRWRASTSKMITYSQAGRWTVILEDEQDTILNEINFEVIKQ